MRRRVLGIALMALLGVGVLWLGLHWSFRQEIKRVAIPGLTNAEVVFVRFHSILDGTTEYDIELPDGATFDAWVPVQKTSPERIREECRVLYDGETLKVAGPGGYWLTVPGIETLAAFKDGPSRWCYTQRMNPKRFRSKVLSGHKGAAVEVPFDPAKAWASRPERIRPGRRGHSVTATLNGIRFESHIVSRSRRFWLLVDERVLRAAKVGIGELVDINVSRNGRRED